MLEKSQVTFRNPNKDYYIDLEFTYDTETKELDYTSTMNVADESVVDSRKDLTTFLVEMFLKTLTKD